MNYKDGPRFEQCGLAGTEPELRYHRKNATDRMKGVNFAGGNMTATTTIPVTIAPEAAAFVRQQGCTQAMDRMVEHALDQVAHLQRLHVRLALDPEIDDPRVILEAYQRPFPEPEHDQTEEDWDRWVTQAFPWEVFQHFCFMTLDGAANEGQSFP
jgi:hypothetical protein